jgi:hypothetical protein
MARAYTVAQIITRARRKADMENSEFIGDEEALDLFNESYTELYDLLVSSFEEYYVKDNVFVNLIAGQSTYDLPADFYKGVGVDYQLNVTGTGYLTLKPFTEAERNGLTGVMATIQAGTVKLRYIPAPKIYTDLSEEVDGISGWETLMVTSMAISMRIKEESSTNDLELQYAKLMKRIEVLKQNRDTGMPARINDIYKIDVYQQFATLRYQYTGSSIKFLSTEIISPVFIGMY